MATKDEYVKLLETLSKEIEAYKNHLSDVLTKHAYQQAIKAAPGAWVGSYEVFKTQHAENYIDDVFIADLKDPVLKEKVRLMGKLDASFGLQAMKGVLRGSQNDHMDKLRGFIEFVQEEKVAEILKQRRGHDDKGVSAKLWRALDAILDKLHLLGFAVRGAKTAGRLHTVSLHAKKQFSKSHTGGTEMGQRGGDEQREPSTEGETRVDDASDDALAEQRKRTFHSTVKRKE